MFRFYDNDDDGEISLKNLQEAADLLEMEDMVRQENLEMMIEMGDPKKKGHVSFKGFMRVMGEIGIIP